MDILSVQSHVSWGYVGNAVAVPTAQALGVNIWPINTVRLAHHPGHATALGKPWGSVTDTNEIVGLMQGALAQISGPIALQIGYLGHAEQGMKALDVHEAATSAARPIPFYLDPAFGDEAEGIYVSDNIVDFYKTVALPRADVLMPNRFELTHLSGQSIETADDAVDAARTVIAQGPKMVLVSSVPVAGEQIGNLLITRDHAWMAAVPRLKLKAKGTGDMLSAAFVALNLSGQLNSANPADALQRAVSLVHLAASDAAKRGLVEMDVPDALKIIGSAMHLIHSEPLDTGRLGV
jgi:pyridoxine kinase